MPRFEKQFVALKYFLMGRQYFLALRALEFARKYHTGKRKDQVTPELAHQIEICLYITTLKDLKDEETTIAVALLHDVMEDYDISMDEMVQKFGQKISDCVWNLTKKHKDKKKEPEIYFEAISQDPIASIVKGADRIHNIQSMINVFSKEKQVSYLAEVEKHFLPMIKKAKYSFPEQAYAYFNIQHMLESQMELIKAIHKKG